MVYILFSTGNDTRREFSLIWCLSKDIGSIFILKDFILELDKIFRNPIFQFVVFFGWFVLLIGFVGFWSF